MTVISSQMVHSSSLDMQLSIYYVASYFTNCIHSLNLIIYVAIGINRLLLEQDKYVAVYTVFISRYLPDPKSSESPFCPARIMSQAHILSDVQNL